MVKFDNSKRSYTVTFSGDEENYFNSVRAISQVLSAVNVDLIDQKTMSNACNFLNEMLPASGQKVKIE